MTPQREFVIAPAGDMDARVDVMRTEALTDDMHARGYHDYVGPRHSNSWLHKLNAEGIALINNVFAKDFELFGYQMQG